MQTRELNEFFGANTPPYAILSHRWEEEEVTFQDLLGDRGQNMKGWSKIIGCCNKAIKDGLEFAVSESVAIHPSPSDLRLSRLTPVVSTRRVVQSSARQSILCSGGTRTQKSVTHTFPTCTVAKE